MADNAVAVGSGCNKSRTSLSKRNGPPGRSAPQVLGGIVLEWVNGLVWRLRSVLQTTRLSRRYAQTLTSCSQCSCQYLSVSASDHEHDRQPAVTNPERRLTYSQLSATRAMFGLFAKAYILTPYSTGASSAVGLTPARIAAARPHIGNTT